MAERRVTVFEHIDELRRRLTKVAIAIAIAAAVCFYFSETILNFMMARLRPEFNLVYKSILEPFMVRFKLALIGGIIVASPVIFYQFLAFVSPALKGSERRVLYPVAFFMALLFVMGSSMGYFIVMPMAWKWLFEQGQALNLIQILSASDFINFVLLFLLAFGVGFETPLVLAALMRFGVVSRETLRKNWRIAYIVILVIASIATPDASIPPMVILAGSMIVLYEATLLSSRFWQPKR